MNTPTVNHNWLCHQALMPGFTGATRPKTLEPGTFAIATVRDGLTVCLAHGRWYNGYMSFPKLIYSIAVLIIIAWVLSNIFRLAAWLINGLLYVAILVVIIGLIAQFISQKKQRK